MTWTYNQIESASPNGEVGRGALIDKFELATCFYDLDRHPHNERETCPTVSSHSQCAAIGLCNEDQGPSSRARE